MVEKKAFLSGIWCGEQGPLPDREFADKLGAILKIIKGKPGGRCDQGDQEPAKQEPKGKGKPETFQHGQYSEYQTWNQQTYGAFGQDGQSGKYTSGENPPNRVLFSLIFLSGFEQRNQPGENEEIKIGVNDS